MRLDGFTDYFQIKLFDGTEPGYTTRQTFSANAGLMQVLSPYDVLSVGLDYTLQFGFLATSFYSIFLNNIEKPEVAPPTRNRVAVSGRYKHSFSDLNALELGYRYYYYDWNIQGHTVDARYFQYLFDRHFLLEPNVRFYTQTAAYFFKRHYTYLPNWRTSDSDLGDFTGAVFGLRASVIQLAFFPHFLDSVTLGGNYWLRNDGLDIFWGEIGFITHF